MRDVAPVDSAGKPIGQGGRTGMAAVALAIASAAAGQAPIPAAGPGFDVERYHVVLHPALATTALSGSETITFRSTADALKALTFSASALQVGAARLDGRPVKVVSSAAGVVFELPRALGKGATATLSFAISGVPARGVTLTKAGLYTSYFACDWMVCLQDAPGDKAHFSLDLRLPAGATSLGVGRALPLQRLRDGSERHRWRSTRPYSSYLFGFAAGHFPRRSIRTDAGEFVYLDATGENRNLSEVFVHTPSIARFLAGKAGIAVPDRRYVQLLVPGREAQEAATFSLIGEEELERERQEPATAWVIAHEMAHQWWGNLVTCESWSDFWLNEGITTFMGAAWKEHAFGRAAYEQELDRARQRIDKARAAGFDKPLAWSGTYPSLGTRRAVQYSKGALFLAHLREDLGETIFWDGMRAFARRHAGGVVTSVDFQRAMEAASGRDLSALFAQWVYGD
ncbi:MAG TPA: M1 family aminopeptidase [Tahibacter sp.]|uniref:M1 family aminopeptidase n=1 Tax=Tahibacter sp. TaxID=2056211 RepID=UPI002B7623DC|nr:M1 family aminopeptidase [Tahibacter sp.]HSX59760.1 M1 family aminopeptidase [Tahibacter sp.]